MWNASFRTITPAGLVIDDVVADQERVVVADHPVASVATCPNCGVASTRVHSRYERRLLDLPIAGRSVYLRVQVRRFRCPNRGCTRVVFGEQLADDVASKGARRTTRLEGIVHHIGIALGGRPAATLARRLMLPGSRDTRLRVVRRRAMPMDIDTVCIVGIDDFAWKRGQRYGTLLCDLEHRRIIDLLPDREIGTVADWLAAHPEITVVSRDRGGGYGPAAAKGAPQAVQVADRWHLIENASAAFLEGVRRSMRTIRQALGSTIVNPDVLSCAERLQYEGFTRRQENKQVIKDLASTGMSIKEITRRTGRSRKLVRTVLRGEDGDMFRCRTSIPDAYLAKLDAEWQMGCRNGAELWRRLRAAGFRGGLRVVTEWTTRRRRSETASLELPRRTPPARLLSRLMTMQRDQLSKAVALTVAAIETGVPALAVARDLLHRFHRMLRDRNPEALASWLTDMERSPLASLDKGIRADFAAVRAAMTEPWSNGQTEGQITKLKVSVRSLRRAFPSPSRPRS